MANIFFFEKDLCETPINMLSLITILNMITKYCR